MAERVTPALQDAARQARRAFGQLRRGLEGLRQPKAPPGSLQARLQPMLANALTEKAIINFLNDLVAFYLVKVHWELISQRWLKDPVKHADAWLTVFYLMFLLVRYRKSIAPLNLRGPNPVSPHGACRAAMKNFRVVHRLSRRIRLLAPALVKQPERCYILEILLRKHGAVKDVRSVPQIGSVTLHYDPAQASAERLLAVVDAVIGNIAAAAQLRPQANRRIASASFRWSRRPGAGMQCRRRRHDLRLLRAADRDEACSATRASTRRR
jgi:hypothetical protein